MVSDPKRASGIGAGGKRSILHFVNNCLQGVVRSAHDSETTVCL